MIKLFLFLSLIILLPFTLIWSAYLIQVDPDAEEFFHGDSDKYIKSSAVEGGNDVQRLIDHRPRRSLLEAIKKASESTDESKDNLAKKNLRLNDPENSLYCWLDPRLEPINETTPCASIEELQDVIIENEMLLNQFKALIHYPGKVSNIAASSLMDGNRLLMSNLHLMAILGNSQEALSLWKANFFYWKNIYTTEPSTLLGRSILHLIFGQSMGILPAILNNLEEFSESDYQQLQQLLQPIEPESWNLEETIREEYVLYEKMIIEGLVKYPFLIRLNNRLITKNYKAAQKFLILAEKPLDQYCVMVHDRKSRYSETTTLQSIINFIKLGPFNSVMPSPASKWYLMHIDSIHANNTRMALASLFIQIKHKNLKSSDVDVFIKKNLNVSRDPRSNNQPFKYNEQEDKLFFESFENCLDTHEIYMTSPK